MAINIWTTAVSDIYIWGADYSAIQWPCDSWFHIPSPTEWNAVISALWQTLTYYFDNLHMPDTYYVNRSNATLNTSYWPVRFWANNMTSKSSADAFQITEANEVKVQADKPSNWFCLRAFKDNPVAPDSSWTETLTGLVYYNSSLWLISVKNWSDWITMQDKNVWATVVYNYWDTVNDNNAGYFYQYGNSYWFPHSLPTQFYTSVRDTTGYWPTNPYSDNHFVKVSTNNRFSNTNNDIWGWVTGVQYTRPSAVYVGTTQIRPI